MTLVIPDVLEESCATRQALERFAAKWRVLLVYALLAGPQRHAQLRRRLPGISQKVLTETLRGMEADGLVERRVVKQTAPQHVEYRLTELGLTLQQPLTAICTWATTHPSPG
jgi:DNA-binding HxlR family transcriptional regulator